LKGSQGNLEIESPQAFAKRIGVDFKDTLLLNRALTHRSFLNEHPDALEDNERLEYLGDAVLDFIIAAWLYNHFPEMREGELTRMRAALVSTEQLAEFARDINIGAAMMLGKGEEDGGGRDRSVMLCSMFESLLGALFIDTGIPAVEEFLSRFIEPAVDSILVGQKDQDPKSNLQEWAQAQAFGPPTYQLISTTGPDHARIFEVVVIINLEIFGKGSGTSKQAATKQAANNALKSLGLQDY